MYPAIYYEVPSYDDELYHHGVKGMRWGVRRYQNVDGTLTDSGKRRIETIERRAAEKLEKHNRAKARAIAAGNPKEISKYVSELSTVQLNDAWSRIEKVQKIRNAIPEPTWKKVVRASGHAAGFLVGSALSGIGKGIGKIAAARAEEKAAKVKGKLKGIQAAAAKQETLRYTEKEELKEAKKDAKELDKIMKRAARQTARSSASSQSSSLGKDVVDDFWKKLAENDRRLAGASPRR